MYYSVPTVVRDCIIFLRGIKYCSCVKYFCDFAKLQKADGHGAHKQSCSTQFALTIAFKGAKTVELL